MADRYTEADRVVVRQALTDLLLGKRVQQVTIAGKTIQYAAGAVSMVKPLLEEELAKIDEYLDAKAGRRRSRSRRAITSKGL